MHYVASPTLIEEMLVSRADAFRRDEMVSKALAGPVERETLFFSEGAEWKWQRRALSPAFRHENILALVPHFVSLRAGAGAGMACLEQGATVDISTPCRARLSP